MFDAVYHRGKNSNVFTEGKNSHRVLTTEPEKKRKKAMLDVDYHRRKKALHSSQGKKSNVEV